MSNIRLNITRLWGIKAEGVLTNGLIFVPGVNVIVGNPNTGKSKWLEIIDFLFGDPDTAIEALGEAIYKTYIGVKAEILIGDVTHTLERYWRSTKHAISKTYFDGNPLDSELVSDTILKLLGLPNLRFPTGNPSAERKWPRLSWRMMLRHIYRKETSWNELAYKQPVPEQAAVLLVFLGVAQRVFPEEYGTLINLQKELEKLEQRKDQYYSLLEEISRELIPLEETTVALTKDSLKSALQRMQNSVVVNLERRETILQELRLNLKNGNTIDIKYDELGENLVKLQGQRQQLENLLSEAITRQNELEQQRRTVTEEIHKLTRASNAKQVFSDLKITVCPNCDQSLQRHVPDGTCHVCLQPFDQSTDSAASKRLDFEIQQLRTEQKELTEFLEYYNSDINSYYSHIRLLDQDIYSISNQLRPIQSETAWLVDSRLVRIDEERGKLEQQLQEVEGLQSLVNRNDDILVKMDQLNTDIAKVKGELDILAGSIRFETLAAKLSDGMNEYLNKLNMGGVHRWIGGRVNIRLKRNDVDVLINNTPWDSALGGTNTGYLWAAYNYALLKLSADTSATYPGFSMIDLPRNFSDLKISSGSENYLVLPFIDLLRHQDMQGTQLIITGHSYEGLEGVNRIELHNIFVPD